MRTTVTLDPDVEELVQRTMRERGWSFKRAVNEAIRSGLTPAAASGPRARTPTFAMGRPAVSLDRALELAGTAEDAELARRLALRR